MSGGGDISDSHHSDSQNHKLTPSATPFASQKDPSSAPGKTLAARKLHARERTALDGRADTTIVPNCCVISINRSVRDG